MTAHFDPDALLRAMRIADRLEALPRTGWVLSRVPQPESVAAHCYGVALAAMLLMDAVARRPDPPEVDRARVLEIALLHDLAEALTTDIPAPAKRRIGADLVHALEREATEAIVAGLEPRYLERWQEYADGQTLEARLVKAADKLQMMVKVLQYEKAGHGDLTRFWRYARNVDDKGIPEARALFARLLRHKEEGTWEEDTW